MSRAIYALLVGINDYLGEVTGLNGCVNDVKRMAEFLELRTQGGEFDLKPLVLTSGDPESPTEVKPTRQAVIDGFRSHLCQAGPDDVALFYYSGHGSQEKAPPEFWHLEPDRLDETIVCYDSRTGGSWDLADKELAMLVAEVAQRGAHVLVILDSCHSGSGTRAADGTRIRLAPRDARDRPLDTFIPGVVSRMQASPAEEAAKAALDAPTGEWFTLPHGRHVVISACRAEESAREKMMEDGYTHGVLSYYLLDTLQQVGPSLSYRDVLSRAGALVRNAVSDQNPLIAATQSDDLRQPFLGGAILPQRPYFALQHTKSDGWVIGAGAIHGLARPSGAETTYLAVFRLAAPIDIGDDLGSAIGRAKVLEVGAVQSRVEFVLDDGSTPDSNETYKAIVIATPLPPVAVHLTGDDAPALEPLRQRLASSTIVRVVEDIAAAAIVVTAQRGEQQYRLRRSGDQNPLAVAVPGKGTPQAVTMAAARLEHMAQWMQVLTLENKQSQIPADAIAVEFLQYDPGANSGKGASTPFPDPNHPRLAYDPSKGQSGAPFQLHLVNNWTRPLYCMFLDLTEDLAILTDQGFFGSGIWLKPGEEAWGTQPNGTRYLETWIPDELRALHLNTLRDTFRLIVSTDESDANLLKQDSLEVVTSPVTRGLGSAKKAVPASTLDRLMQRVQTRAAGTPPKKARLSDWRTWQITLTTVDLSAGVDLQKAGGSVELVDGVRILGHRALKGRASLTTQGEVGREIGNLVLPAAFRAHPGLARPFDLLKSRGGDTGSNVIVLSSVKSAEAVTREEPLVIQVSGTLSPDEFVLPIGYDPESGLFLPLGTAQQTATGIRIQIDRLPGPTSDSRDVQGSIKLLLQKVVGQRLGILGGTTRLAAATVNAAGQVEYDVSPAAVAAKVKAARRIVLYIHGFTGDTRGMVASARGLPYAVPQPPPTLAEQYDLILAFDYESINTSVEETAIKLKEHLQAVGLGAGHKKTLHIVAHSLGCMVTRRFIEREGGRKVVRKAILLGPPNAGTPWAKLEDWAIVGLGAAINGLAAVIWPPAAIPALVVTLSSLVAGAEKVDTTLDQLQPGSTFYKALNASEDPKVPYVVIAGDTAKIHLAVPSAARAERALLERLVERLTSKQTRYAIASLAFFGQPNDTTISVESMGSLPAGRKPAARVLEIACDHSSYFCTEAGLRTLAQALG